MSINLMQGDCLELMKTIPDGSVDMVLTDPPYGTTACKWDTIIPLEPMWEQLKRITKKNGAIVMTASQPFTSVLVTSNLKMFKYDWVWEKSKATGFLNAKKRPLVAHESVLVFSKGAPVYYPVMASGKPYNKGKRKDQEDEDLYSKYSSVVVKSEGSRYPRSTTYFKTAESEGKTYHKTQKPVALMEYLIKTYTNEGDTVLDFTMGSGTTGVAAKSLGRDFIGIELDPTYFQIAKERVENDGNT